jgi:hypothetical protein
MTDWLVRARDGPSHRDYRWFLRGITALDVTPSSHYNQSASIKIKQTGEHARLMHVKGESKK